MEAQYKGEMRPPHGREEISEGRCILKGNQRPWYIDDGFHKLGVLLVGVLFNRALLLGVCIRALFGNSQIACPTVEARSRRLGLIADFRKPLYRSIFRKTRKQKKPNIQGHISSL